MAGRGGRLTTPGQLAAPASAGPSPPADGRTVGAEPGPSRDSRTAVALIPGQTWVGLNSQHPGFETVLISGAPKGSVPHLAPGNLHAFKGYWKCPSLQHRLCPKAKLSPGDANPGLSHPEGAHQQHRAALLWSAQCSKGFELGANF